MMMNLHEPGGAGKSRSRLPTSGTAGACAAILLLCGCQKPARPEPPPTVVQVMETGLTDVPASVERIGLLDSPQTVEVRARVESFVDKMPFTEGTEVQEGDLLFKLDDKPYRERLSAARGMLAEAMATLAKYRKDVDRLTPLAAKKAIPQQDLDNATAAVAVGQANVAAGQARVEAALIDLGYCEVKAPVSGLIGARQVSTGELVGKGQPTLLATISTLDPIWFYFNVSEVDYLKTEERARQDGRNLMERRVTLVRADGTPHPVAGRFVFVDRAVDVRTGTLRVRVEFPNPGKLLRPGMFARIRVDLGVKKGVLVVPERALTELQGKSFAWVVDGAGKAAQRPVKTGETTAAGTIILEGLKPGERIVVEGTHKVREGMTVKTVTAPAAAGARPAASGADQAKRGGE